MMVSVSTLISDIEGVTGSRFQESLGVVNNYAKKDKLLAVCITCILIVACHLVTVYCLILGSKGLKTSNLLNAYSFCVSLSDLYRYSAKPVYTFCL